MLNMAPGNAYSTAITVSLTCMLCCTTIMEHGTVDADSSSNSDGRRGGARLDLNDGTMGNYEVGQTQLKNIQQNSQHPRYGKCWTNALEEVTAGCQRLTDDEQSRMAMSLANCHLAKAEFDTYPCNRSMSLSECLSPMKGDAIAFNTYTEFFTHTQDICFFLQSQAWHEHTEETVEKLAQSSENVADRLEVTGKLQEAMIYQQNESLQNQKQILAHEAQLKEALQSSTNNIKEVFAEMRSSTLEQKALFAETFERVAQVQKLMLGEFTWFNSLIFFAVVIFLAYVLTSTPRTAGARFGLFLLLLLNWVAEWVLFHVMGAEDQTTFHSRTWLCRKTFCMIGLLFLVFCATRYRDYNQINHSILLEIQRQLKQRPIHSSPSIFQAVQSSGAAALSIVPSRSLPAIQQRSDASLVALESMAASDTKLSITEFHSDGSDAEMTFRPENLASSGSCDSSSSENSFVTANPASRRPSRVDESFAQMPYHGAEPSTSYSKRRTDMLGSTGKRKPGRPKGSTNRMSREGTPLSNSSFQSPYNLRRRMRQRSPNPVLDLETTVMFAQHIENMASRHYVIERQHVPSPSNRKRRSRGPAKASAGPAFFSSDEEF